jgi:hypothetical protein
MTIGNWVKSNVEYGRTLADSGLEGARQAKVELLQGESMGNVLAGAAKNSWAPALAGVGLGVLIGYFANRKKPVSSIVAGSLIGGVAGFGAGIAWQTRQLSGGIARGAVHGLHEASDSHWLQNNPVNFG